MFYVLALARFSQEPRYLGFPLLWRATFSEMRGSQRIVEVSTDSVHAEQPARAGAENKGSNQRLKEKKSGNGRRRNSNAS
jgi:hypothetical protein